METDPNHFVKWEPLSGYLVLLPSRTSNRVGNILLPDSYTKKNNAGICIKAGATEQDFIGKEVFFPNHSEYRIVDSETGYQVYVIESNKILMQRTPPEEINRVSREKEAGITFETIEHSKPEQPLLGPATQ